MLQRVSEEFRKELKERLTSVYKTDDWDMRCYGCYNNPPDDLCDQLKCAQNKDVGRCLDCKEYCCSISPVVSSAIKPESIQADDVTWTVLPYVQDQYDN